MYFSFIEIYQKRKPRESSVLANPKIVKNSSWSNGIKQEYWSKEGDKVIREPEPQAWRIILNHSFRRNGKVKKVQGYIHTVTWWDVVDEYLLIRKNHSDDEIQIGWLMSFDGMSFNKKVRKKFPDANLNEVWEMFQIKAAPIEEAIISEFKEMEEYLWFKAGKKIDAEINAKNARKKEEEKRQQQNYQEKWRQEKEQYFKDNFSTTGSPNDLSLTQDQARIINSCYRAMAKQLHPDKGGDVDDMKVLNGLIDKIRTRL